MEIKLVPYTDKFPIMYQVYLSGYIIQTTNEGRFNKLVEYLKSINAENWNDIPLNKRGMLGIDYTVRMIG